MSHNAYESAFPIPAYEDIRGDYHNPTAGLTKREYFAGLAMQGLAANAHDSLASWDGQQTAECAVKFADALLAELAK